MIWGGKIELLPIPSFKHPHNCNNSTENLRGAFLCCEKAIRLKIKLDRQS